MRSNHDPAIVTLFHSTLEHTLDHFLEFWIFEGVRHFLGLLNQPPTNNPGIFLVPSVYQFQRALILCWKRHYFWIHCTKELRCKSDHPSPLSTLKERIFGPPSASSRLSSLSEAFSPSIHSFIHIPEGRDGFPLSGN